jgi:hypothetical protein
VIPENACALCFEECGYLAEASACPSVRDAVALEDLVLEEA